MSRHVIFDNNTFPYESNRPSESPLASSHLLQTSSRIPRFDTNSISWPYVAIFDTKSQCISEHTKLEASSCNNRSSSQNHPPIHLEQPSLEPDSISQPAAVAAQNTHPLITRSKDGIYKPKIFTATKSITKPTIVSEALQDTNWKAAMKQEFDTLLKNKTWTMVPLPF